MSCSTNTRISNHRCDRWMCVCIGKRHPSAASLSFWGGNDLLDDIPHRLKDKHRVLLVGMGGSGKTAIAAMVTYRWLQESPAPVLWLHAGNADFEEYPGVHLSTGCCRPTISGFGYGGLLFRRTTRSSETVSIGDRRRMEWKRSEWFSKRHSPGICLPLLVTSRQGFPKFQRVEVGDLSREDAIAVLGAYAGWKDYQSDPDANRLCKALSYHAYALEIAGANLDVDEFLTPATLLNEIAKKPHESEMPAGMAEPGRENVGR